jgi:hypothetical protein
MMWQNDVIYCADYAHDEECLAALSAKVRSKAGIEGWMETVVGGVEIV